MNDITEIKQFVAARLSKKRYLHTKRVADWADDLAKRHGIDRSAVQLAAYLHDVAKQMTFAEMIDMLKADRDATIDPLFYDMPQIVHAAAGASIARRILAIDDVRIINAICYHTTGRSGMDAVETVIYIADATEAGRDYPKLKEHRALAKRSLSEALRVISGDTICYLIKNNKMIHPNTLALYNSMVKSERG